MTDWMNAGILLVFYFAVGLICAIIREYYLGAKGQPQGPDMFFAVIAFWPFVLPVLGLYRLCRWVWAVGFNRNLPPLNQHPTAKERRK